MNVSWTIYYFHEKEAIEFREADNSKEQHRDLTQQADREQHGWTTFYVLKIKLQNLKMTDQFAGHEIARHEIAGHENAGHIFVCVTSRNK